MTSKICLKCNELKSLDNFGKDKSKKDGFNIYCKCCITQRNIENKEKFKIINKKSYDKRRDKILLQKREYTKLNKDKKSEYNKQYVEKNKDKIKQKNKKYFENNKEELYKKQKIYYKKNIKNVLKQKREYYYKNKSEILEKVRKYSKTDNGKNVSFLSSSKRRKSIINGDVTKEQLRNLRNNAKVCYWCNTSLKNKEVHIDHYIPLIKGGLHTISNLVVSCDKCNLTKNAKDPIEFAMSIGKLF